MLDVLEPIDSTMLRKLISTSYEYSELVSNSLFINGPFTLYSDYLNNTITVALFPEDVPAIEFFKILENRYNYIAGKGNDFLKNKVIRIRTFGWDLKKEDVIQFLEAVHNTLNDIKRGEY